jgi:hypothetical protein
VSPDALPIFHLGLIVSHLGGSRDLVKRDQQQIGRHNATVEPVDFSTAFDAAHHPDIVADHLGFDLGNKIFQKPERIGRPSHSHNFRTPPANFLNGAFARIAAATRLFQGDLRAFVKRKSGKTTPYNSVVLRMCSIGGTT